ncbi:hypothetical protein GQX74_010394 [Glossina fuscipes]|nr:hypothetical protein GQX74_010394 [Glossina fuscipes]
MTAIHADENVRVREENLYGKGVATFQLEGESRRFLLDSPNRFNFGIAYNIILRQSGTNMQSNISISMIDRGKMKRKFTASCSAEYYDWSRRDAAFHIKSEYFKQEGTSMGNDFHSHISHYLLNKNIFKAIKASVDASTPAFNKAKWLTKVDFESTLRLAWVFAGEDRCFTFAVDLSFSSTRSSLTLFSMEEIAKESLSFSIVVFLALFAGKLVDFESNKEIRSRLSDKLVSEEVVLCVLLISFPSSGQAGTNCTEVSGGNLYGIELFKSAADISRGFAAGGGRANCDDGGVAEFLLLWDLSSILDGVGAGGKDLL